MWRREEEALFERLSDEALLERVWAARIPPSRRAAVHPRAAGTLAALRGVEGGADAITRARAGDLAPLTRLLDSAATAPGRTPVLLHHLALFHGSAADGWRGRDERRELEARGHALTAWLALGDEADYLRGLAGAVVGGALDAMEIDRMADDAALRSVDALGREAIEGARERTDAACTALRALAYVETACERARCGARLTERATRRAASHVAHAVAESLAPIEGRLAEASARGAHARERGRILEEAMGVWRWADELEDVERFVIDQATPMLWEIFREKRWDDIRGLLQTIMPAVQRMARRIEEEPDQIAYAGPCAQMFVFLSDVQPTQASRIDAVERAVALCPSHRNGRVVLAELLCERAIDNLDKSWMPFHDVEAARRDIARAEALFPAARRLERAKKRLWRHGGSPP